MSELQYAGEFTLASSAWTLNVHANIYVVLKLLGHKDIAATGPTR